MKLIILYSLMCYGISAAFVYYNGPADILAKLRKYISKNRKLDELFSCMFCLPTNIGFILSILSLLLATETPFTPFSALIGNHDLLWPLIVVFDGFFTGAVVSIIDAIVETISPTNNEEEYVEKGILND